MSVLRDGAVALPIRRRPGHGGALRPLFVLAVGSSAFLGLLVGPTMGTLFLRWVLALAIAFVLVTLSLVRPGAGLAATFTYLVFMAFLRRILIPISTWNSFDGLLLVAPVVAIALLVKFFVVERRRLAPDLLSKLVLLLLVLTFVEVANPTGTGIKSNLVGLLFAATPLFFFFVGREVLGDDRLLDGLNGLIIVLALICAAYGLYQTQVGYPSWDQNWLNVTASENNPFGTLTSALSVGGQLRAVGPFSSFWEYAEFVGSGLVIAFAFVVRRRYVAFLAMPPLAVGLFLASNRSGMITSLAAVVVMLALLPRRPIVAALITLCALGGAYGALKVFSGSLSSAASSSSSSLVSHQLSGLSDPTSSQDSTLFTHLTEVVDGVKLSFHYPAGLGPGATNNAAGLGQASSNALQQQTMLSTEVDISNVFVSFGPAGGVLYIVIMLLVLWRAAVSYFRGRDAVLPVIGVLIVGGGQWLTGSHYALSPLTWLLIGGIAAGSSGAVGQVHERTRRARRRRQSAQLGLRHSG